MEKVRTRGSRSTACEAMQTKQLDAKQTNEEHKHSSTQSQRIQKVAARKALQQPEPRTPKQPSDSSLQEFDPARSHHCSKSLHAFVSRWVEAVHSDKEKRCQLDSHLRHSNDDLIPRELTRPPPAMSRLLEADDFVVPPMPPPTDPRSHVEATKTSAATPITFIASRSGKSLVEDPFYRNTNLAGNNIYIRPPYEALPEQIAGLVDYVRRSRDSPGPSLDQVMQDRALADLQWTGAEESQVKSYFSTSIFPYPNSSEDLQRNDGLPMSKAAVPATWSKFRISNPMPDILYGYSRHTAFTDAHQSQFYAMGTTMFANSQSLVYPFLAIEFKGDGPSGSGSMWVAENQCLGASATCVNISERLNDQLRGCKSADIQPINSAAFSIAMSGTEVRLHVSWKHNEQKYYMANVKTFLLQDPGHYVEFRRYVLNIIDWGRDRRLNEIRHSLDNLLEESRKKTSKEAKSRQPPFDESAVSGKRPTLSSLRDSRSDNSQA